MSLLEDILKVRQHITVNEPTHTHTKTLDDSTKYGEAVRDYHLWTQSDNDRLMEEGGVSMTENY